LHGLRPDGTYVLQYASSGETRRIKGATLMERLRLEIPVRDGSELMTFQRTLE
jgi:hypothetical protein